MAVLSPSSAERWMHCPGSVRLCADFPDTSSVYAEEGTAAHELAERILQGQPAEMLVGRVASNGVEFTQEMLENVLQYTGVVQALELAGALLFIEQKLPIAEWTGEYDSDGQPAKGTADAVLIADSELVVMDLKYGRGVEIEAEGNKQLALYALAALAEFELAYGPFEQARLIISQPRLSIFSEWVLPVDTLLAFGEQVKAAANACRQDNAPLNPGDKACRFCRAKAVCPALREHIVATLGVPPIPTPEDFRDLIIPPVDQDPIWLSAVMGKIPLIEAWCKAVRAEVERRLLSRQQVPGYKLVQGRQGIRKWVDPEQAEVLLKEFCPQHMFDLSLISPTKAEKLAKANVLSAQQWAQLQKLVIRTEGALSVAPEADGRPAFNPQEIFYEDQA